MKNVLILSGSPRKGGNSDLLCDEFMRGAKESGNNVTKINVANKKVSSWGPFAEGRKDFFTTPVLTEIGKKYGKTAAQTALRFLIQSDVVVIPKSTRKERMVQNMDVFDFALDDADMKVIQAIDEGESLFFSHYDPATVEMLTGLAR